MRFFTVVPECQTLVSGDASLSFITRVPEPRVTALADILLISLTGLAEMEVQIANEDRIIDAKNFIMAEFAKCSVKRF